MICRYCGARIQWKEGQGWCTVDQYGIAQWGTTDCSKRPESDGGPTGGHRLPKDPRDTEAD